MFPTDVGQTFVGPSIEQTGNGLTVNVAASDVAVPHKLLNTAR
jgi:hypothetical protein